MHKTAIRHGLIIALILILLVGILYFVFSSQTLFDLGEVFGYTTMVIAMLMVYFGIKRYRDKELNGQITFGQAFGMGVYIAVIGSFLYGIFEGIFYEVTDFKVVYMDFYVEKINNSGQSPEVIQQQLQEMQQQFAMWDSPFMMGLLMFLTVFIIGVIIALASAAILRKKPEEIIT
jgi:hypothetical protein